MSRRPIRAAAAAIAIGVLPLAAQGQGAPAPQPTPPSYAQQAKPAIRGVVATIDAKYAITIHDDRGYDTHVALYDGTIINPTGLRLLEGMRVAIVGHLDGSTFVADRIETPYYYRNSPPYW